MGYIDDSEINPYAAPKEESVPLRPVGTFGGYAGFWVRFVAIFIDGLLLSVVGIPLNLLSLLIGGTGWERDVINLITSVIGLIINLAYYGLMTSSASQATVGKMAMGLKVTDLHGRRISLGRSLGRELAKILSGLTCLIGYIMVAFTERKQGLHDMIAGTLVIKAR